MLGVPAVGGRARTRRQRPDGNALRAAVLGANDGLVSNFSLVMGVAGAGASREPLLVAGVAGLLAGSLSMALGEWLSVQSSRELYAREVALQAAAIDRDADGETDALAERYEAKGIPASDARRLATHIIGGERRAAVDTTVREHLGIDPRELGGSAWTAAITSFVLFALGAAVPLLPFLVANGTDAVIASALVAGAMLFVLGAGITIMTGRHPVLAGARQLGFGMAAAAITFGIGSLLGTVVA
jgi:VIT1/CCC1 family predicted Fe2+/Mn2+ transporter